MRSTVTSLLVMVIALAAVELAFDASAVPGPLVDAHRYVRWPREFSAQNEDPDVVVIGDSRTIHGVNARKISETATRTLGKPVRVLNLGMRGAPPLTHLAWTSYLEQRSKPPALAIVQVSAYMFGTGIGKATSREALRSMYRPAGALAAVIAGLPIEDGLLAVVHHASLAMRLRRDVLAVYVDGEPRPKPAEPADLGYVQSKRVPLNVQRRHAFGRAAGYRKELSPPNELGTEMYALLDATIRRLQALGTQVVVMTTPSSSPLWRNDADAPLYRKALIGAEDVARRNGARFVYFRDLPRIDDRYFTDGDHLNIEGALLYSELLARLVVVPSLAPAHKAGLKRWSPAKPAPECAVVFDFEELEPVGWELSGDAFELLAVAGMQGAQGPIAGWGGQMLVNTFHAANGDRATGRAMSPAFAIDKPELRLLVGGGRSGIVQLIVQGAANNPIHVASGADREQLTEVRWNVADHLGKTARLRIIDSSRGPWGHLLLDDVQLCAPGL